MYQVRFYFTLALCMMMFHTVDAQNEILPFKRYGIGVEIASTTGFGLEIATPIARKFALRAGISMFPYSFKTETPKISMLGQMEVQMNEAMNMPAAKEALKAAGLPTRAADVNREMDITASLGLVNGKFLVDFYPGLISSFHFTAGLYIGKEKLINLDGKMKQLAQVMSVLESSGANLWNNQYTDSDKYRLTPRELSNLNAAFAINTVKPYIGLGFGRAVPKRRVGVSFDFGAFYMGAPKIKSDNPNMQNMIDCELVDLSDVLKYLSWWPTMSLKINVKI